MPVEVLETFSDLFMACPQEWENGPKPALVTKFGDGERAASHPWTGAWKGSFFELETSDTSRRFREELASPTDRYWIGVQEIKMTTRDNRAVLGIPYTVWVGYITSIKPTRKLALKVTMTDIVSAGILNDQITKQPSAFPIPWRVIRDSFVLNGTFQLSEMLDLDHPEPRIYGIHRRIPDEDPASPQGFEWTPIYLGIENGTKHVWMVAGHACADLPDVFRVNPDGTRVSVLADGDWEIPHTSAPAYEDQRSPTYGIDRRYTLIRADVGNDDANAIVAGEAILTCFVNGVEPDGDGGGEVIQDRIQQYKHWLINDVAHRGPDSYQSGFWLSNPTISLFDRTVTQVDEASFDAASAIAALRLPFVEGNDYPAGYVGAVIIGATPGERRTVTQWIADWNRSCGVRFGVNHFGQLVVGMLSPTQAIKDAAPLYTDALHMIVDTFDQDYGWDEKINRLPWQADYEHRTGRWMTSDIFSWDPAIVRYGAEILPGEPRDYPMAPGETMASHMARMEVLQRIEPLKPLRFEVTVGPDHTGDSLGYRDLFSYIRYRAYPAVSNSIGEIRLAYIIRHQVKAGGRTVFVEALDCEELIDFDQPVEGFDPGGNETCETALEVTEEQASGIGGFSIAIDTTTHATDAGAPASACRPNDAFRAAWFTFTPTSTWKGHVTTGGSTKANGSALDTVLAVYTGDCGDLDEHSCNDNDGIFPTSFLDFDGSGTMMFVAGTTYKFLVTGYTDDDFGNLVFTLFVEPL